MHLHQWREREKYKKLIRKEILKIKIPGSALCKSIISSHSLLLNAYRGALIQIPVSHYGLTINESRALPLQNFTAGNRMEDKRCQLNFLPFFLREYNINLMEKIQ